MEESQERVQSIGVSLKLLSAFQIIASVCLITVLLFLVKTGMLEKAGDEIRMSGRSILYIAVILLLLVAASGLVSLYRIRYGWMFTFFVASLVLLIGLLLGTRTIVMTRISFFVMMIISAVAWAGAVVHYFWDLYT
jgi:hypothetical protein